MSRPACIYVHADMLCVCVLLTIRQCPYGGHYYEDGEFHAHIGSGVLR